tara:strand:- start:234 stop:809 length:576 start_codon:yes stop_codon:yes gene_type:complete
MTQRSQINGLFSPYLQKSRFKKIIPYIKGNLLDIGCSTGEILSYLSTNIDYIGIEGNPIYFDNAQTLNPNHKFINLYLNNENSKNLDIPKIDTILMLAILEHLDKPLEVLKNLKNYLSENSRIIITTPSSYSKYILKVGSALKIFMNEMHEHKNHFSKKELFSLSEKAGMKVFHHSRFELGMNHLLILEIK